MAEKFWFSPHLGDKQLFVAIYKDTQCVYIYIYIYTFKQLVDTPVGLCLSCSAFSLIQLSTG